VRVGGGGGLTGNPGLQTAGDDALGDFPIGRFAAAGMTLIELIPY
jgi:hypothetical protein